MMKRKKTTPSTLLVLLVSMLSTENTLSAAEATEMVPTLVFPKESLTEEIKRGFYSRIHLLNFGIIQKPKESNLNPDNFLDIPRYQAVANPRIDLSQTFRRLDLDVKLRYLATWQQWEDGRLAGEDEFRHQFFVNEWYARLRLFDELIVTYGRRNLQWGSSVILSSSNPFNLENGRNNTQIEVPGLDYATAIWIPNSSWSVSTIANLDEGRLNSSQGFGLNQSGVIGQREQSNNFERSYALKIDYTGDGKYASVIPSYREHEGYQVGFIGGWNVSEAVHIYTEGSFSEHDDYRVQAGASYTLEAGPKINIEYYHNNNGCLIEKIEQCFLQGEVNSNDILFRQDYFMVQYTDTNLWRYLNLNLRIIHNINDSSNRLIGNFEYEVGDNTQLYLTANGFTGNQNSEYGSLLRYSIFLGIGYTF